MVGTPVTQKTIDSSRNCFVGALIMLVIFGTSLYIGYKPVVIVSFLIQQILLISAYFVVVNGVYKKGR